MEAMVGHGPFTSMICRKLQNLNGDTLPVRCSRQRIPECNHHGDLSGSKMELIANDVN